MNPYAELHEAIGRAAHELPPSALQSLAEALLTDADSSMRGLLASKGRTARSSTLLSAIDTAWSSFPQIESPALGLALLQSLHAATANCSGTDVSLIWTGPSTEAVPVRRTEQALCELIESAQKELWVVSFVVYKAAGVLSALKRAAERDVEIKLVLETEQESGGKLSFDSVEDLRRDLPAAELLVWPLPQRERDKHGHHGTLHAKCAVADRGRALIGSANLTEHALSLNMELGVILDGGEAPRRFPEHFEELVRRGVLVEAGRPQ